MSTLPATGGRLSPSHSMCGSMISATVFLIAALLLVSCASPATPPISDKDVAAKDASQNSLNSSGGANRGSSAPVAETASPRVSFADTHRLGNADAKIIIVEFSDYQCPYCSSFHLEIFPMLKEKYVDTGIVQYIHKDLPLTLIHAQAMPAALAANCAGSQNRYWEMNHALYANQTQLGQALYFKLASGLKLDEEKFSDCLKDSATIKDILRDTAEAQRFGINATPSFVIGKVERDILTVMGIAKGVPSFEDFAQAIEKLRQQAKRDTTSQTK